MLTPLVQLDWAGKYDGPSTTQLKCVPQCSAKKNVMRLITGEREHNLNQRQDITPEHKGFTSMKTQICCISADIHKCRVQEGQSHLDVLAVWRKQI